MRYQIESCPRYEGGGKERAVEEHARVQAAFWGALLGSLQPYGGAKVELRYTACPRFGRIGVGLSVLSAKHDATPPPTFLRQFLPHDYHWSESVDAEPVEPPPGGWHVVRLVRRLDFFNVPDPTGRWVAAGAPAVGAAPWTHRPTPSSTDGTGGPVRFIPESWDVGSDERHREGPLCIPYLRPVPVTVPDGNRLCMELLNAAPAVLSVTLNPADVCGLAADRPAAGLFRRWAEPLDNRPHADPSEPVRALVPGYDRYWLGADRLCRLTARVAAADRASARAVGHWLAAQCGGPAVFEVLDLPQQLASLDDLSRPGDGAVDSRFESWLAGLGVAAGPDYQPFLRRMPHLYTLDEALALLRLPYATETGLAGLPTRLVAPFYPPARPPTAAIDGAVIRVGRVMNPFRTGLEADPDGHLGWHAVPTESLTRHALIVGRTGQGKSVATQFLLRQLARQGVPFLVVEPIKAEYYDRLKPHVPGLIRWRLEGTAGGNPAADYLRFDPMRLQRGVSVARHTAYLKSCFQAAFPLSDAQSLILENGVRAYYTVSRAKGGCGMTLFTRGGKSRHFVDPATNGVFPSFTTFARFFLGQFLPNALGAGFGTSRVAEFVFEWQKMFERRLENLAGSPLGVSFALADTAFRKEPKAYDPFHHLTHHPAVVELDGVTDPEHKALLMALLLTFLFERRQADDLLRQEGGGTDPGGRLTHVLLIEEAHRLLARPGTGGGRGAETVGDDARARAVALFADLIAEIRAYGQCVVIVEQIPTKVIPEVVKNTGLKLMFQIPSRDDRDYLGEAMAFTEDQKQFATTLGRGECVVFDDRSDRPSLVRVPPPESWGDAELGPQGPDR